MAMSDNVKQPFEGAPWEAAPAQPQSAIAPPIEPRPSGLCAGEFVVPDDFDAPLPEDILREFESV
jgi:hypothetical protein